MCLISNNDLVWLFVKYIESPSRNQSIRGQKLMSRKISPWKCESYSSSSLWHKRIFYGQENDFNGIVGSKRNGMFYVETVNTLYCPTSVQMKQTTAYGNGALVDNAPGIKIRFVISSSITTETLSRKVSPHASKYTRLLSQCATDGITKICRVAYLWFCQLGW